MTEAKQRPQNRTSRPVYNTLQAMMEIADTPMPLTEKAVLMVYVARANAQGVAWPGNAHIMERTKLDRRTIMRARRKLVEKKWLTDHEHPGPTRAFRVSEGVTARQVLLFPGSQPDNRVVRPVDKSNDRGAEKTGGGGRCAPQLNPLIHQEVLFSDSSSRSISSRLDEGAFKDLTSLVMKALDEAGFFCGGAWVVTEEEVSGNDLPKATSKAVGEMSKLGHPSGARWIREWPRYRDVRRAIRAVTGLTG